MVIFRLTIRHWYYRAFLLDFEGSSASKEGKKGRFRANWEKLPVPYICI